MKTLPTLLTALAILVTAPAADACSPPQPGWFVSQQLPPDQATDVPLDQPLLVRVHTDAGDLVPSDLLETRVTLVDGDGVEVPGTLEPVPGAPLGRTGGVVRFRPAAALRPNTRYTFTVHSTEGWDEEVEVENTVRFETGSGTFEVGHAALGTLSLEPGVREVFGDCVDEFEESCGGCFERESLGEISVFAATVWVDLGDSDTLLAVRVGLGATAREAEAVRVRMPTRLLRPEDAGQLRAGSGEAPVWAANTACVSVEARDVDGRLWLDETACGEVPDWTVPDNPLPAAPPGDEGSAPGGCSATPGGGISLALLLLGAARRRDRRYKSSVSPSP